MINEKKTETVEEVEWIPVGRQGDQSEFAIRKALAKARARHKEEFHRQCEAIDEEIWGVEPEQ